EGLHVGGKIETATLLARLDEHHEARVWRPRLLHRFDGGEGAEGGVSVVLGPAAVEAIAAAPGNPRAAPPRPPGHLRVLVAVSVEQDGLRWRSRLLRPVPRSPSGEPYRLHG